MRKYETDYAGAWRGYCKTRETAVIAAIKHIMQDGYTVCTITDREKDCVVARIRLSQDRKQATIETVTQIRKQHAKMGL